MSGSEGSNIPEVVKKQAERADQIHRQMYPDQYPQERKEENPGEGNTPPEGAAPKPEETPKAEEKPKEEVKEAPKPPEKAPEPVKAEEDWKHKYDVLLGKYNAEVPKLHTQLAAMQNMTRELQGQISEIKAAKEKQAPPKETPPKEEPPKKVEPPPQEADVVKTFKEEYPDIYEAVARMIESAQAAKPAGTPPKAEEKPKTDEKPVEEKPKAEEKSKVERPSPATPPAPVTDPRITFDYYLNRDIPDWAQINKDPEFVRFLQTPDPNYPGTKLQSIQAAYDACDFTTVIGHFRDFKESRKTVIPGGGTAPSNPPAPPTQPEPKPEGEKPPEEKFLAPPKGGRGGTPPSPPLVTPSDLAKFYDEARRGLWGPIDGEKFRKEEARLLNALTGKKT